METSWIVIVSCNNNHEGRNKASDVGACHKGIQKMIKTKGIKNKENWLVKIQALFSFLSSHIYTDLGIILEMVM